VRLRRYFWAPGASVHGHPAAHQAGDRAEEEERVRRPFALGRVEETADSTRLIQVSSSRKAGVFRGKKIALAKKIESEIFWGRRAPRAGRMGKNDPSRLAPRKEVRSGSLAGGDSFIQPEKVSFFAFMAKLTVRARKQLQRQDANWKQVLKLSSWIARQESTARVGHLASRKRAMGKIPQCSTFIAAWSDLSHASHDTRRSSDECWRACLRKYDLGYAAGR
jgi:hypothetical protein